MRIAEAKDFVREFQEGDELIEVFAAKSKIGSEDGRFDANLFGVMPVAPDFSIEMRRLRKTI